MTKKSPPATKDDLLALEARMMNSFKLLTEHLVTEFRAAGSDKFSLHDDQIQECRKRLVRLEHRAGLGAA